MQTTRMHQSIVSVRVGFVLQSAEIQLLLLYVISPLQLPTPIYLSDRRPFRFRGLFKHRCSRV